MLRDGYLLRLNDGREMWNTILPMANTLNDYGTLSIYNYMY